MGDSQAQEHSGTKFMDDGIRVDLSQRYRAAVYVVRKTQRDDVG